MNRQLNSLGKGYQPRSMSFAAGFMGPMGNVGYTMVFSQELAEEIAAAIQIKNIARIEAGLDGDYNENSMCIFDSAGWHEYTRYDNSIWATPIIIVVYTDGTTEAFECWVKEQADER